MVTILQWECDKVGLSKSHGENEEQGVENGNSKERLGGNRRPLNVPRSIDRRPLKAPTGSEGTDGCMVGSDGTVKERIES